MNYIDTGFFTQNALYCEQEVIYMNEFEKDPQEKTNDVPHAVAGFVGSFVFFSIVFAIGSAISFIHS